jgi:hypothetical protein
MNRVFAAAAALLSTQFIASALLVAQPSADDREKLLGNWKLVSFVTETASNGTMSTASDRMAASGSH